MQLLLNIVVEVELHLVLHECGSARSTEQAHVSGAAGALRKQTLGEALELMRSLLHHILEEEHGADPAAIAALRRGALSGELLSFFRAKLDESLEALLSFYAALGRSPALAVAHAEVAAGPALTFLAEYLAEDSEACKQAKVHAILPVLLALPEPTRPSHSAAATADAADAARGAPSVLHQLLPALLLLSSAPGALSAMCGWRRGCWSMCCWRSSGRRGAARAQPLLQAASAAASAPSLCSDDAADEETREAEAELAAQVAAALATIGNAAAVLVALCEADASILSTQLPESLRARARPVLAAALRLASAPKMQAQHAEQLEEACDALRTLQQILGAAIRRRGGLSQAAACNKFP